MDLSAITTLTFDCYGTLIDWERGIVQALSPWLARHGRRVEPEALLALFARFETEEQQRAPGLAYPDILARVMGRIGEALGVDVEDADLRAFGASVGDWPPFPDSAAALGRLARRFRLVVLSNVDRESFARSKAKLKVVFHRVFTAEDIGAYKPDPRTFAHMLEALAREGTARDRILHVAQSLYHDILPAQRAGLRTCWIDRREGRAGGATPDPSAPVTPDLRFSSLQAFADFAL